jgi:hypothetical protein
MKRQSDNAKIDSKGVARIKPSTAVPLSAPGAVPNTSPQSVHTKAVWSNYIESRMKQFGGR